MGIFELAKVITLAFAFGALGVLITAVIVVRVIAKRRPELFEAEDEDEDEDDLEWIAIENDPQKLQAQIGWLSFTRANGAIDEEDSQDDVGTPFTVPIKKIEYVARRANGRAYLGCYKVKERHGFYFSGYKTVESYEEILKRIKEGNEKCQDSDRQ